MTDIPVLFQPELVDAIDAGRKTMTRRLAWGEARPVGSSLGRAERAEIQSKGFKLEQRGTHWYASRRSPWQKVKVGDRLWVREQHWRWGQWEFGDDEWHFRVVPATLGDIFFGAEPAGRLGYRSQTSPAWHKRPSIFMPREHSRFTLIVTAVKMEPVQSISEEDARMEGVKAMRAGIGADGGPVETYRTGLVNIWRKINGEASWLSNPEVVAVTFRVIKANIGDVSPASQTHTGRLAAAI